MPRRGVWPVLKGQQGVEQAVTRAQGALSVLPFAFHLDILPALFRPLRIEFPGAVYHVTSRGDGGEAIFGHSGQPSGQADTF